MQGGGQRSFFRSARGAHVHHTYFGPLRRGRGGPDQDHLVGAREVRGHDRRSDGPQQSQAPEAQQ
eukprot:63830-Pyramimonas_sp.AAC.1